MPHASLTVRNITAQPVVLKLKRPVVARIATITEWPLILIDLLTEEGIVGTGALKEGRLQGDLVLVGAGDANLSNRVFPFAGPVTGSPKPLEASGLKRGSRQKGLRPADH